MRWTCKSSACSVVLAINRKKYPKRRAIYLRTWQPKLNRVILTSYKTFKSSRQTIIFDDIQCLYIKVNRKTLQPRNYIFSKHVFVINTQIHQAIIWIFFIESLSACQYTFAGFGTTFFTLASLELLFNIFCSAPVT